MLAKKTKNEEDYVGLVPERLFVQNEVVALLALHRDPRYLTAFEIEQAVSQIKGDPSKSVQLTGSLRQLLEGGLIESKIFPSEKTKRKITKYKLTPKGDESAVLFVKLFRALQS